ncbi:MAG: apolipoprotein N-acyltransferase [Proteobacteria bacterium]|nr:apolipoprotein N-acyltransferase [Desulfobulbaceae bacterium]MBU4153648.1 apolipoprotein N-acyltransferase [Pseudomonadota bacterium]
MNTAFSSKAGQGRRLILALVTSLILFVASPGQWAVSPLAWVALVPLLLACRGLSAKASAWLGLLSGVIYFLSLIYWIIIALGRYGGLPLWLTLPALLGLAFYMGLSMAAFAAMISWSEKRLPTVWIAPMTWVGLDFVRAWLFTGFPWLDLGYSQFSFPLVNQTADITGHHGITFLIVMVNTLIARLIPWPQIAPINNSQTVSPDTPCSLLSCLVLPLFVIATACGYSLWRAQNLEIAMAQASTISIGLIQGNIDQSEKWLPGLQEKTVNIYLSLSEESATQGPIDLLIWPETALPFFPSEHPLFQRVTASVTSPGSPSLLTGAPHFESAPTNNLTNYFNSAFLITPASTGEFTALQRYDKEHLVPFGEYIPLQNFLPKAMPLVQTMGNFSPGTDAAPLIDDQTRIGVLICFESIFPNLARIRTLHGANILVNLTNDAWYGRSSAPYQQVPMAVLRAIENRRSLARSANTGISCLIDPVGKVLATTTIFEAKVTTGRLPLLEEKSFYSQAGYLFPNLCLLCLSLLLLYGILQRDRV